MTYAIAKHFRGELIAYMVRDRGNEELTFTSRDLADAFEMDDRDEAEQLAHDWQDYWQSKGFTATTASIVEVKI